ncbi:hypothetical protein TNCT_572951 [Trichonephila clavata]|uniref:Uncharacterized protein n=1 Tax=Trichonephila clavata TaxID=2740835 RepID=A0A8X6J7R5_TRICU|nr:hypothetical protein TNCT_572951 [Trichonephila clavata]
MIYKMCERLGFQAQLAAEPDREIWVAKKKLRPIPKVDSKTILMFCKALSLDAELALSNGRKCVRKSMKAREASSGSSLHQTFLGL